MIRRVTLQGFRGIPGELSLELRRITLLCGRNGLGKTTVLEGIDWCLFGPSSRVGQAPDSLRNLYRPSPPYAEVIVTTPSGAHTVGRTEASATLDGVPISDRELLDLFVTDWSIFPPYFQGPETRIRTLMYLEQADIRKIVSPVDEDERTALYQGLLGVPNVALVRSSLRRLSERFDARANAITARLSECSAELASTAALAPVSPTADLPSAHDLLQQTRAILHDIPESGAQLDMLASFVASQHATAREWIDALNRLAVIVSAHDAQQVPLQDEIQRRRIDVEQAEAITAAAQGAHTAAQRKRLDAEITCQRAQELLAEAKRNAERSRRLSRLVMNKREAEMALSRSQEIIAASTRTREQLETQLSQLAVIQSSQDATLRESRSRFEASKTRQARERRRAEVRSRRSTLVHALDGALMTEAQARDRMTNAEAQSQEARLAAQRAVDAYGAQARIADVSSRINAIVTELLSLSRTVPSSQCPLCGTEYGSANELLSHISALVADRAQSANELATLQRRVSQTQETAADALARTQEAQRALGRAGAALKAAREELKDVDQELAALDSELSPSHSLRNVTLDEVVELERALAASHSRREQLQRRLAAEAATIRAAERDVVSLQSRLARFSEELAAELPGDSAEMVEGRPRLAEDAAARAQQTLEERKAELEAFRAGERDSANSLASATEAYASARSSLIRAEGALAAVDNHLKLEIEGLLGHGVPAHDLGDRIRDAEDKARRLEEIKNATDRLVEAERSAEARRRLTALRTLEAEYQQDLATLEGARKQFAVVSDRVRSRATREEKAAVRYYRAAIQECFRGMLPHAHLDEIEIDEETGRISVLDRWLRVARRSGVAPELYLSSGQANALGLALFLGTALRQRVIKMECVLLDEPIQNLDDIHFLAFMTLLKRIALSHQVVLSTADSNMAALLQRQIKSSWDRDGSGYAEHEWVSFSAKDGPEVVSRF